MLAQNDFFVQCTKSSFVNVPVLIKNLSLLCNTFEKLSFTMCLTENGALEIAFCIQSYVFYIPICWMSLQCLQAHNILYFVLLALCVGLYMRTAQYGDQIIFNWQLHVAFSFTNGTERLKARVASRGCIGQLHDGIMTRVPQQYCLIIFFFSLFMLLSFNNTAIVFYFVFNACALFYCHQ